MPFATLDDIPLGHKLTVTRTVTEEDSETYSRLARNEYAIHADEEYAKQSRFGARVMPGLLTFAMNTEALTKGILTGLNIRAALISVSAKFIKPVYIGDTLTLEAEVAQKIPEKNRIVSKLTATNQKGELVMLAEMVDQLV